MNLWSFGGKSPRGKGGRLKDELAASHGVSLDPVIPFNTPIEYLTYRSPISQRYHYGVETMAFNFSDYKKVHTWRLLWIYLARAQKVCVVTYHEGVSVGRNGLVG